MKHKEFGKVTRTLSRLNDEELCKLYQKVRRCEWDYNMGEKPNNYDNLPEYPDLRKWYQKLFGIKTKFYYTKPYIRGIQSLVSMEKIKESYDINIEKKSQEDLQRLKHEQEKEDEINERRIKVADALISCGLIR